MPALFQTGLAHSVLAPAAQVITKNTRKTSLSCFSISIQNSKTNNCKKKIKILKLSLGHAQHAMMVHMNGHTQHTLKAHWAVLHLSQLQVDAQSHLHSQRSLKKVFENIGNLTTWSHGKVKLSLYKRILKIVHSKCYFLCSLVLECCQQHDWQPRYTELQQPEISVILPYIGFSKKWNKPKQIRRHKM